MDTQLRDIERRRFDRHHLILEITVREPGGKPKTAKLCSLSAGGCAIDGSPLQEVGARLWVRLPGLESQLATIVRGGNCEVRATFCRPLHTAVVATYAEASRFKLRFAAWTGRGFHQRSCLA
jgi:hypothetical protein